MPGTSAEHDALSCTTQARWCESVESTVEDFFMKSTLVVLSLAGAAIVATNTWGKAMCA
jgi:hypothetical protein